jgi:hypothetical protein
MTTVVVATYQPWSHRAALRLGEALTAWGRRPATSEPVHAERVARMEAARDSAARTLPQLPR